MAKRKLPSAYIRAMRTQKFHKFDLVKVDVKSDERSHFDTGFYGVIAYSYMEKYGGSDNKDYSVVVLNESLTKATNQIAWYDESDLTLSDKLSNKQVMDIVEDLNWIDW